MNSLVGVKKGGPTIIMYKNVPICIISLFGGGNYTLLEPRGMINCDENIGFVDWKARSCINS